MNDDPQMEWAREPFLERHAAAIAAALSGAVWGFAVAMIAFAMVML